MSENLRRARRLVRRAAGSVAASAPPTLGPKRWTAFVERIRAGRAARLADVDPHAALRMVEPMLTSNASTCTWTAAALAYEKIGDTGAAMESARRGTASSDRDVPSLMELRSLVERCGHPEAVEQILGAVASTQPRNKAELIVAASGLREATPDLVGAFRQFILSDATNQLDVETINEVLDEDALVRAHERGSDDFDREKIRVLQTRRFPFTVVINALMRRRAWDEVAKFVAVTPGSQLVGPQASGRFPLSEVKTAASKALQAGHATAAAMLAARALAANSTLQGSQYTFDAAQDQIRVARNGWSFPTVAATTPYEPDGRAALAVLSQSLPITSGGYATRSHGILRELAASGRKIEAVTRLGFPYDRWKKNDKRTVPSADTVDGIVYRRLVDDRRHYPQHPLASYVEEFAVGVERIARSHRAALIHASSFYVTGMAGLTAARRLGVPFIYEMRGLEELMKISRDDGFAGSDRETFLRRLETSVAAEADATLIITGALRDEMIERGVDPDRAFVVPNGVHTEHFQPAERDRELEARFGFGGKTVIGYVGGLVDYEGLELLFDAVALLKHSRDDDFRVLVVGDGAHQRKIRDAAERLRLTDVVTFTGRVPHSEVNRYISLVDIAPFPRLPLPVCELISPIKPFESMSMAKAVVVSSVAALTEIVADGQTGRVFTKGDATSLGNILGELIDDPDQRRVLGARARDWVIGERDWTSITTIVDEVYDDVLARSGADIVSTQL